MITALKIRKKGKNVDSPIITLSPAILELAKLKVGDDVVFSIKGKTLIISKQSEIIRHGKIYAAWSKTDDAGNIKRTGAVTSLPTAVFEAAGLCVGIARVEVKNGVIAISKL